MLKKIAKLNDHFTQVYGHLEVSNMEVVIKMVFNF